MVGALARGGAGFTLLEALVALTITALLLFGIHQVVDQGTRTLQRLERKREALHLWTYLRRLLHRDLEHLITEPPERMVLGGREGLTLRCSGAVVPDWHLGGTVEVVYRWQKNRQGTTMTWERWVRPLPGDGAVAELTLRIDQGLKQVAYDLLVGETWHPFGEFVTPPWLAMRWQFDWEEIGAWQMIRSLPSPRPMQPSPLPDNNKGALLSRPPS
ncbi:MAG: prepilin-type N-terminal cleavage/methylation domain-containing protein [Magnetococcales bacterium]|nr:prepilin-type N-terminal cleavage/methylation domain-containing protein [Magnetococcales bacterium]